MKIITLSEKLYNISICHNEYESYLIANNNSSKNYKYFRILIGSGIYNLHHTNGLNVYVYMTDENRNKILKKKLEKLNGRY